MRALKAAKVKSMGKYALKVEELIKMYGIQFYWIIALAEGRMRLEHFTRLMRRARTEHTRLTTAGLPSKFDPKMPWDFVIRMAVNDTDFWQKEVHTKIMQWLHRLKTPAELTDAGYGAVQQTPAASAGVFSTAPGPSGVAPKRVAPGADQAQVQGQGAIGKTERAERRTAGRLTKRLKAQAAKALGGGGSPPAPAAIAALPPPPPPAAAGKGKGKGTATHFPDGRLRSSGGKQFCFAYGHSVNGCAAACPNGRLHQCEFCLGAHRTCQCPQNPSWTPVGR